MNWSAFKTRFSYNYKKYLAIFFSAVATALVLALAFLEVYVMIKNQITPTLDTPINAYNIAFLLIAYLTILIGNVNSNNSAYTGVLIYIFATAFSMVVSILASGIVDFTSFWESAPIVKTLTLCSLGFSLIGVVSGFFAYFRLNQYLRGSAVSYTNVRNWTLVFVIFQVLVNGFSSAIGLMSVTSNIYLAMEILMPLSEVFICLAIYFTVLRLRSY
jgi:hypothetical protein